ncbi:hypothetical protein B0T16DRAFT_391505 [Cercophora newfieldiana]|uniref:TLDc domain-containing protein n=1 Tax=Cercophora newfieldiana TaxID=92897 RepID=A0AA39XYX6_9PEZI|nr:hypothetical protein B0T16DRAFT_391505 [Cercophora newfieldiana]
MPFPSPGDENGGEALTLAQLNRALMWILSDELQNIFPESNSSRLTTLADQRRFVFQSLANCHEHPFYASSDAQKLAPRSAFDVFDNRRDREFHASLCGPNYDERGDEIYHNMLHVLYSIQPDQIAYYASPTMDAFRPVADKIRAEKRTPLLRTLAIPAHRFTALVRLLLAMQFAPPPTATPDHRLELADFNTMALSITAACTTPDTHNLITHPQFEHALHYQAPYLLDSLHHFLSTIFRGQPSFMLLAADLEPPTQLPDTSHDQILTLPLASQIATFLADSVGFSGYHLHTSYTASSSPDTFALIADLTSTPETQEAMMLLSGRDTTTGQHVIFGLYTPRPQGDGPSTQDVYVLNHVGPSGYALFQLEPVHGFFRGTVGKPGWTALDAETVVFGELGAGVCLTLQLGTSGSGRLSRGSVRQVVVQGQEDEEEIERAWDREDDWLDEKKEKRERKKQG